MKETILKIILILLLCAASAFGAYQGGKSSVYAEDYEYFNKTEALLDSINSYDESFMDNIMETDVYYEYELAREKVL